MNLPENIADAAARLVALHGPDGFTMDDLAREAGLSRATLYRQAGSREAVLAALSEQGVEVGKRVDVRDRILAACRAVFTRAGFEAATLEDIAREAGVGPATVYRQFGDKAGLISAFAGHIGPRRAMQEVALRPTGDLRADLERAAATVIRYAAEDLDLLKLAILERMRGGPWAELLKDSPVRAQTMLIRLLKSYAASGALGPNDPQRMAQAFAGMLFAFFARPLLEGGPMPDPEETARFITHVFLDGLASTPRRIP
ncbi:TetR/AcrR family transcriptional regulator [Archangium lansingense]|uniref:TetR/AcrR family transcriptional regulator n=1 Tax=Archangium lansingense TaxID=2995310 RepID=A0ABT4ABG4_9BACT|nr:TetR/AcrR family transcriptional regulator [Archangium lansinium]MCY1078651.1 TetR/AcrR family transcriptional regulator [Archangium lansinium]